MTTPNALVRRANVEDLEQLAPLWQQENLAVADLERRFKEFQVVQNGAGELLGAIGMQIAGLEGRLHSEVFARPDQADALRETLWERAQVLASNHGLARVWTQLSTPFWHHNGFRAASGAVVEKLPAGFTGDPQPWFYLQLKDDTTPAFSLDHELALLKEAERERTEKIHRHARALKMIAAVVAFLVFALVIAWAFLFMKSQRRLPGP